MGEGEIIIPSPPLVTFYGMSKIWFKQKNGSRQKYSTKILQNNQEIDSVENFNYIDLAYVKYAY